MKHVIDAEKCIKQGNTAEALQIVDNILSLAPGNVKALTLKAKILDAWGRFDESLHTLQRLSQNPKLTPEEFKEIEQRAMEEKESLIYSELTAEGRCYHAFPMAQVWVSFMGFMGCAAFLIISPSLLSETGERLAELLLSFGFLVVMPWLALITVHFVGIKKIFIGLAGLKICKRLSFQTFAWDQIKCGVIEYGVNINEDHLKIHLYSSKACLKKSKPLITLDVSAKNSVVKARRHFVRNLISYLDVFVYLPYPAQTPDINPANPTGSGNSLSPSNASEKATDKTKDVA